jgi:hypothetical protein
MRYALQTSIGLWFNFMFRYLLASYLLLIAITGAAPCCCTIARASQEFASLVGTKTEKTPSRPNCCHSSVSPCCETKAPTESSEEPAPKRCQCEKASCDAVVPEQTVVAAEWSQNFLLNLHALLTSPMTFDVTKPTLQLSPDGSFEPLHRSGRDVRVVYCSWRC